MKKVISLLVLLFMVFLQLIPVLITNISKKKVEEKEIIVLENEINNNKQSLIEGWLIDDVDIKSSPSLYSTTLGKYNIGQFIYYSQYNDEWAKITYYLITPINNHGTKVVTAYIKDEYITQNNIEAEYRMILNKLESSTDKKKWFVEYKEIVKKYSDEHFDTPETIYDCFSEEELDLLFRVVQAEVGDEWGFIHKANVANVIFNRLYSEQRSFKEQNTLLEVLNENQFSTIKNGRYKKVIISQETILACEYAFLIEDTTNGALFFDSNGVLKYKKIFNDGVHNFYKLKE